MTGAAGMLGRALVDALSDDHDVIGVDVRDFDLSLESSIAKIEKAHPEAVCHLAAFTDVDGCESDPERAYRSNVVGTRNVAVACREAKCPMLYVSTDYVFDGKATEPYRTDAHTSPLNMYGRTKLIGEWFVERNVKDRCIVRSSWLFGEGGRNFVETILSLAQKQKSLDVVDDQRGTPTYTRDLALALKRLMEKKGFGVYHVTNGGDCTWHQFAGAILNSAGITDCTVNPVESSKLGRAAERPSYSVLDNTDFIHTGEEPLRGWMEALTEYLERRSGGESNV